MPVAKAFQFAIVAYTGTGSALDVTSPGFDPDVILIKKRSPGTSSLGALKIRGENTKVFSSVALQTDAVTAHLANGFSVGTNIAVNESGRAYDAICLAGSNSHFDGPFFGYGSYVGNSADDRDIVFSVDPTEPDFVFLTSADASGDHFAKWADITGDAVVLHLASAGGEDDIIQAINADGFQIGTQADVDTRTYLYFWIRFGTLGLLDEFFTAGVFNRGAIASGSVTGLAFQPAFVVAKQRAIASGYYKTAAMGGSNNQSWEGSVASSTVGVVALNADGFDYTDAIGYNGQSWFWAFASLGNVPGSELIVETSGGITEFEEDDPPVVVDAAVIVDYFADIGGAYVAIASNYQRGQDFLDCTDAGDLDFDFDAATGILTIGGFGSASEYQDALRNVTFESTGPPLSQLRRRITFQATTDLIEVASDEMPAEMPFTMEN